MDGNVQQTNRLQSLPTNTLMEEIIIPVTRNDLKVMPTDELARLKILVNSLEEKITRELLKRVQR